jgi:hypothetical protein
MMAGTYTPNFKGEETIAKKLMRSVVRIFH